MDRTSYHNRSVDRLCGRPAGGEAAGEVVKQGGQAAKVLVKLGKQGFLMRLKMDRRRRKGQEKHEYFGYRADKSTRYPHSEIRKRK